MFITTPNKSNRTRSTILKGEQGAATNGFKHCKYIYLFVHLFKGLDFYQLIRMKTFINEEVKIQRWKENLSHPDKKVIRITFNWTISMFISF